MANNVKGVQPKFSDTFYFELAIGLWGYQWANNFEFFEVSDPLVPVWRHAEIWAPKYGRRNTAPENPLKPLLWGLHG